MTKKTQTKHVEKNNEADKNPVHELVGNVFGNNIPTKTIDKSLDKIGVKSETISKTVDLVNEVKLGKSKKSLAGKGVIAIANIAGYVSGEEILSKKEKKLTGNIVDKSVDVLWDEEKLKKHNDHSEEIMEAHVMLTQKKEEFLEKNAKHLGKIDPNLSLKDRVIQLEKSAENLKGIYGKDENGKKKNGSNVLGRAWEKSKDESNSWLGRIWAFFPLVYTEYKKYKFVQEAEKYGIFKQKDAFKERGAELKKTGKKIQETGKKVGKEAAEKAGYAKKISHSAKRSGSLPLLKLLKSSNDIPKAYLRQADTLLNALDGKQINAKEFSKQIAANYETSFGKLLGDLKNKKISPDKFATLSQAIYNDTQTLAAKNRLTQNAFLKLAQKNGIAGMPLKKSIGKLSKIPVGAVGIASAINISVIEAIEAGKFSTFFDSITSTKTLTEAFLPIGTYNNFSLIKNSNDPLWLKGAQIGLHIIGDGALIFGYIGAGASFGASAAGGIALRGGLLAAGRKLISRESLKIARKSAIKTTKKAAANSALSASFSAGIAILAKKFKGKDVEKFAGKAYMKHVAPPEQKRLLQIEKRYEDIASGKTKKESLQSSTSKLTLEPGGKKDIEKVNEAA